MAFAAACAARACAASALRGCGGSLGFAAPRQPAAGRRLAARAAEGDTAAGGSVLDKLKRRLAADAAGAVCWEDELARAAAAGAGQGRRAVSVCEATEARHIAGAAAVLARRGRGRGRGRGAEGDEGDGDEEGGPLDVLVPLIGLAYMRLLSSVSLQTPLTSVAVAEGGDVVGMAEVKKDGYVRNLAVDAASARGGVGTRLLCWCARAARSRGASELWMHVALANEDALVFYRRLNFTFGATEHFGSQQEVGIRLSRPL